MLKKQTNFQKWSFIFLTFLIIITHEENYEILDDAVSYDVIL